MEVKQWPSVVDGQSLLTHHFVDTVLDTPMKNYAVLERCQQMETLILRMLLVETTVSTILLSVRTLTKCMQNVLFVG